MVAPRTQNVSSSSSSFLLIFAVVACSLFWQISAGGAAAASSSSSLRRGLLQVNDNAGCSNTVEEIQIVNDKSELETIQCTGENNFHLCLLPVVGDTTDQLLVYQVCPEMCNLQWCQEEEAEVQQQPNTAVEEEEGEDPEPEEEPEFDIEDFAFKCENQRQQVSVFNADTKQTDTVACEGSPSTDTQPYCFKFDLQTNLQVWKICPLMCMTADCSENVILDPCSNQVTELQVIKNEKDKVIDCKDLSTNNNKRNNKNADFCKQFDAYSEQLIYKVCPLMCLEESNCVTD